MPKLWENKTPYYNADYKQPETNIIHYLLDGNEKRSAVIVCPGGGYCGRADHEGEPIAKFYNEQGYHAFVLEYRVNPYQHPVMLCDVLRAIKYVRYHAKEWNIDEEKIAILGFSAGGHLASTAALHFDYPFEKIDDIDNVSAKPNAAILCYSVISVRPPFNHTETSRVILGNNPDKAALAAYLSGEVSVRDDTPPVFMWHTADDAVVPVENCLNFAKALRKKDIPFELHVFPHGNHGLGLAQEFFNIAKWGELSVNWLKTLNF